MSLIVRVRKHERGLKFQHGDYTGMLAPGRYILWERLLGRKRTTVQVVSTLATRFENPWLDVIVGEPASLRELEVIDLTERQRAFVWVDGRLHSILGPGRHVFWRTPRKVEVERNDIGALRLEHPMIDSILAQANASAFLEGVEIGPEECVLLFRSGTLVDKLGQGRHVFWKGAGKIRWKTIDLREQVADVAGQEIMTADKVTLRVNLVVTFKVVDAVKAATVVTDFAQAVYREAQLVLRAAVGGRTLDNLLADKESIGGEVRSTLLKRACEFGVSICGVGLKDIILPGEMKAILNQVIQAQKEAEANLIKRREETAAARSQANTARLLAENPTLARIKELELLQGVLAGTNATFVLGPSDVAEQVRSLIAASPNPGNSPRAS
jgi:regulator of protease activity HflC (stomatin/prohibitin superfamily)